MSTRQPGFAICQYSSSICASCSWSSARRLLGSDDAAVIALDLPGAWETDASAAEVAGHHLASDSKCDRAGTVARLIRDRSAHVPRTAVNGRSGSDVAGHD